MSFVSLILVSALAICCSVPGSAAPAADEDSPDAVRLAESIEGKWVVYRRTSKGTFMRIKEHRDGVTTVTTYSPDNVPIYAHRSRYTVDDTGDVSIFRYGQKSVLLGPDASATDDRESAYIFRVDGDRFYEVHGMLPGDSGDVTMTVWKRLRKMPELKPDA